MNDILGGIYVPSKYSQNIVTSVSWDVCSECMNVQEEIQEQIVNSLRFLFSFIFSVYTRIAPIK